jgi:hypothetical protein
MEERPEFLIVSVTSPPDRQGTHATDADQNNLGSAAISLKSTKAINHLVVTYGSDVIKL